MSDAERMVAERARRAGLALSADDIAFHVGTCRDLDDAAARVRRGIEPGAASAYRFDPAAAYA